ncbi:MAG: response regulator [Anaerolineae bacterium]
MDGAKILIVEDETITILDLQDRLRSLGYDVAGHAMRGEEAIHLVRALQPDLVLMDVRLGGEMDGIQTAEAIRSFEDVPVVFLTAYSDDDTLRRARIIEPFGYLLKPFAERELYTTIEMALHKHHSEQALKQSERRLRLYARRLEALQKIDRAVLAADGLETIAQYALRCVEQLLPCRQACVLLVDDQMCEASFLAIRDNGQTIDGRGVCGQVSQAAYWQQLARGSIQILDQAGLALQLPAHSACWAEPMPFYANAPLLNQDALLGVLSCGLQDPADLGQEQLEIVREIADSLAIAIHQARLRDSLAQHAAELEASNVELNAFAHTVAHDIQDPLGIVIGFADILAQDWASLRPEDLQEYLKMISQTGHIMNNIVRELLLLAETRTQDVATYPLDMGHVVAHAQSRLEHMVKEYEAEVHVADDWPRALGYGPWVEEVWLNYLSNAIKYGGRPPRVDLGATAIGDQVRFWVRDNGAGVPSGAQARLFVPFTRLSQARVKGHGLGLSIVRRIVEKLGGQVSVESEGLPGAGSTFVFTLPAAQD